MNYSPHPCHRIPGHEELILVWVIDPEKQTVAVYAPKRQPHILRHGEQLSGEDILPGLLLPLTEIFR